MANSLFFQRVDRNGRRYGSLALINSKSHASYWLQPKHIGHILGIALASRTVEGRLASKDIDKLLNRVGIECNHVEGKWTGVSLQRYRNIISFLTNEYKEYIDSSIHHNSKSCGLLAISILLQSLWQKSNSKACLLEYLLAYENVTETPILLNEFSDLRNASSTMTKTWLASAFTDDEMTDVAIEKAMRTVFPPSAKDLYHDDAGGNRSGQLIVLSAL